jgi:hypothetical protein
MKTKIKILIACALFTCGTTLLGLLVFHVHSFPAHAHARA